MPDLTSSLFWSELVLWAGKSLLPLAKALAVFLVGWFVIKLTVKPICRLLEHSKIDRTLHAFVLSLVRISLIVLLAVSCAVMSGLVSAASVVTALGAIGLAVSLAVKDGLSDLAGGLSLLAAKPFAVGDYISTDDGMEGTVEKIDLVHTLLKTVDNKQIYMPNGKVSHAIITNYTREPRRRLDLEWNIGYTDDFELAKRLILEAITSHPSAESDPAPLVRMNRHGEHAIVLVSRVWVSVGAYWDFRFDLLEEVKRRFDSAGVTIPYPQLDVHTIVRSNKGTLV